MPGVDVSVVIVSYNTRDLLASCLRSIEKASGSCTVETIVVDNGSADGSVEFVREHFPDVTVVVSPENGGFAHGTNRGLERAKGRYHLWLNSDCELPANAIPELVAHLEHSPEVGIVGPRLVYPDGRVQPSAQAFPNAMRVIYQFLGLRKLTALPGIGWLLRRMSRGMDRMSRMYVEALEARQPMAVDWVSGACLLARGELIHSVGPLDEMYFMYCEDADWCHRVARQGARVEYLPTVSVVHLGGASGSVNPRIVYHYYRSLLRYFSRYRPRQLMALRVFMFIGFSLRGLGRELARLVGRGGDHPWWRLTSLCISPGAALQQSR